MLLIAGLSVPAVLALRAPWDGKDKRTRRRGRNGSVKTVVVPKVWAHFGLVEITVEQCPFKFCRLTITRATLQMASKDHCSLPTRGPRSSSDEGNGLHSAFWI